MRDDRWSHMLNLTFLLEEQFFVRGREREAAATAPADPRLCAALDDLMEVFPSSLDPVDEFEAFTVRRFTAALRGILCTR